MLYINVYCIRVVHCTKVFTMFMMYVYNMFIIVCVICVQYHTKLQYAIQYTYACICIQVKSRLIFYSPTTASELAEAMSGGHILLDPFSGSGLLPVLQAMVSSSIAYIYNTLCVLYVCIYLTLH